ncbi:hypothetical protein AVEN_234168-1, partial [Araneus ventricosus]
MQWRKKSLGIGSLEAKGVVEAERISASSDVGWVNTQWV